jgi:hypothetical protein
MPAVSECEGVKGKFMTPSQGKIVFALVGLFLLLLLVNASMMEWPYLKIAEFVC